jgi:hypothetical protein
MSSYADIDYGEYGDDFIDVDDPFQPFQRNGAPGSTGPIDRSIMESPNPTGTVVSDENNEHRLVIAIDYGTTYTGTVNSIGLYDAC